MRAIANVRYHDEPVTFDRYGQLRDGVIGGDERGAGIDRDADLARAACARRRRGTRSPPRGSATASRRSFAWIWIAPWQRSATAATAAQTTPARAASCRAVSATLRTWSRDARRDGGSIESTRFEDHDGASITFGELLPREAVDRRFLLYALR